MAQTLTLPEEFVTRVDFRKFWEYIAAQNPDGLTDNVLRATKTTLLDRGTPGHTAVAYFMPLAAMFTPGDLPHILDEIMGDLTAIGNFENAR